MAVCQQFYQRRNDIDVDYYTSNIAIGGRYGRAFNFGVEVNRQPRSGTGVRSLKVWYDTVNTVLNGIEVMLTDEGRTTRTFGQKRGQESEKFYLGDGEKIISLQLWGDTYSTDRAGGFRLTTSENRQFTVGYTRGSPSYEPDIGSGILVGVFGRAQTQIDCLGFGLLRRVQHAELIEVNYPDIHRLQVLRKPKEIKSIVYNNTRGSVEQTFTFSGSETAETSETWSLTTGVELGVETEVKAGFPILAEGTVTTSLTVSITGTYETTNTHTTEQSFEFPVTVPPRQCLQATATLYEGEIDTRYTARMLYTLDSGKSFGYSVSGTYKGITVGSVVVATRSIPANRNYRNYF